MMVYHSGGLVWCGGGDGLLVVVNYGCCGVVRRERERETERDTHRERERERERERDRERVNEEPAPNPTRCHFCLCVLPSTQITIIKITNVIYKICNSFITTTPA